MEVRDKMRRTVHNDKARDKIGKNKKGKEDSDKTTRKRQSEKEHDMSGHNKKALRVDRI